MHLGSGGGPQKLAVRSQSRAIRRAQLKRPSIAEESYANSAQISRAEVRFAADYSFTALRVPTWWRVLSAYSCAVTDLFSLYLFLFETDYKSASIAGFLPNDS